ncbi:hypothetical protein CTI12_AA058900 [Artemisia annua]|uniref:KIB1-4 beta-propeller domain-containing protein n=1 Tax=Artemisia annua TaxID=35608 RepID=A0A2U1Q1N3_ARTAN|nr:hypothetical protein CTI12_AA058900 [Artemisia annua]
MHSLEHKQISSRSVVPPLSPEYPWFVAQNLEAEEDDTQAHTFFNLHDPLSRYRCKIPELLGKRIRGCFFGCWALLSSNRDDTWSLWNPITCEIINLPPLNHRGTDGYYDDIRSCCLSAPPDHPSSVLLLTRTNKRNLVHCSLGSDSSFPNTRRKEELRWTEMTYAKQVRSITSFDDAYLYSLTSCNGRVYAYLKVCEWNLRPLLVEIKMMVKYRKRKNLRKVVIRFLPISDFFYPTAINCYGTLSLLEGSSTELFNIVIGVKDKTGFLVGDVKLFKLNMDSKVWEEVDDLKETIISVERSANDSMPLFATHAIVSSESGGYIHILGDKGNIVYSYHVKDRTISVSSIPCVAETYHMSPWAMLECSRLEDDHAHLKQEKDKGDEIVVKGDHEVEINNTKDGYRLLNSTFRVLKMIIEFCAGVDCLPLSFFGYESRLENDDADLKQEKDMDEDESPLLNIPLHVLETVMEFCVGVEYLKFRSTCKLCHLAAPLILFKNGKALEKYSLLSPWLMVFDIHKGIITFTDPMFGDKYFIKAPQDLIGEYFEIKCSRYGWLLILKGDHTMLLFNPFTGDIRTLPEVPSTRIFSFSAPPTSPDCMVVALTRRCVSIHFVAAGEPYWHTVFLDFDGDNYQFFTLNGLESLDLYAMKANGELDIYKEMGKEYYSWERTVCPAPTSCCTSFRQSFLVRCEEHGFLQVIVGEFGESVEVFKFNDATQEWVKIDGLGKHMIFISSVSPICIKAKIPEMENKIYFPRLSSPKGNMVFYSLETCRYHTFNNKHIQENFGDFFGTRWLAAPHAWIEPNWC